MPDVTVKLITFQKVYKGITDKDGLYSLEIPNTAIREENLIEFKPFAETLSTGLVTFKKEEILKKISPIFQKIEFTQNMVK